jgi:hypothetical protein
MLNGPTPSSGATSGKPSILRSSVETVGRRGARVAPNDVRGFVDDEPTCTGVEVVDGAAAYWCVGGVETINNLLNSACLLVPVFSKAR